MREHWKWTNEEKLDISEVLDDFNFWFSNKTIFIKTNIKDYSEINIQFLEVQLPHLLGLDKLSKGDRFSKRIVEGIKKNNYADIINDSNFYQIRNRIQAYSSLEEIFYRGDEYYLVVTKNMKPPRLGKVELVFYKLINDKEMVVLGLSKAGKYFVPATLHIRKAPNDFLNLRRTMVREMEFK